MIIRTQSQYISYNQATFVVPAYSKLLNVNYDNGQYTILYECDPEQTESKSFIIEHWESTSNPNGEYYSPPGSKYWGTVTSSEPILTSHTNGMGAHTNISLDLIHNTKHFHIFVQEILSTAELRDKKIEEII
jgi:hypothetical protein